MGSVPSGPKLEGNLGHYLAGLIEGPPSASPPAPGRRGRPAVLRPPRPEDQGPSVLPGLRTKGPQSLGRGWAEGANGNYLEIMEALAHYLLSNLQILQRKGKSASFRVRTNSLVGNLVLVSYFTSFPLFGSKRLDYFDWCQGVELVAKGNHKTTQALASMKK